MSKTRSLLDRLILLVLVLVLVALAVVPDLIGIGAPGFGIWESVLLLISLVLLIAGLALPVKPITDLKRILANSQIGWREVLLLIFSLTVTTVTADLFLRLTLPPSYIADTPYGWIRPENHMYVHIVENETGKFREVTTRYFKNSFKRWGDINTHNPKLFILGDSFTEMNWVSNGEEWYSYLERHFSKLELFVFGVGGYGSLQEYMVLDDYIDIIHPDLILLQFCSNDYHNNIYELELWDYPNSNNAARPYLEEDRIVYRLAAPYAELRQYSFIADRLLKEYDRFMWRREQQNRAAAKHRKAEQETEPDVAKRLKLLREKATYVTLEIMKKVKKRAKETPIYLFNPCRTTQNTIKRWLPKPVLYSYRELLST
jgi:GDSL-like lipase/acylhydrolase family protein